MKKQSKKPIFKRPSKEQIKIGMEKILNKQLENNKLFKEAEPNKINY